MEQGDALKKVKAQLASSREDNQKSKRVYELSCSEMKSEFEEIKSEME